MALTLRAAAAAAAGPTRGLRRLFSTSFVPPLNSAAPNPREEAEPSTNLFVSGISLFPVSTLHFLQIYFYLPLGYRRFSEFLCKIAIVAPTMFAQIWNRGNNVRVHLNGLIPIIGV